MLDAWICFSLHSAIKWLQPPPPIPTPPSSKPQCVPSILARRSQVDNREFVNFKSDGRVVSYRGCVNTEHHSNVSRTINSTMKCERTTIYHLKTYKATAAFRAGSSCQVMSLLLLDLAATWRTSGEQSNGCSKFSKGCCDCY